jgi:hypothetical protein
MQSDAQPDIHQLPIPDWNLNCPRCGYDLRQLPEHRCPECGERFDMSDLVRTWTRKREPRFGGDELPVPDFGFRCEHCGGELTGATQPICHHCGAPFDLPARRPRRAWFAITTGTCEPLPLPIVESLLATESVPFLSQDARSMFDIILGTRILEMTLFVPCEFYFDACWLIRRAQRDAAASREAGEEAEWTCPACGESVPAHFAVWWNCAGDEDQADGEDQPDDPRPA